MNIPVDTTFRAVWLPATQSFSVADTGDTSVEVARVGGLVVDGSEITGGTPPYTILTMAFIGGAPTAGLTITQTTTTVVGDTIQITSLPGTTVGNYAGTIRAMVVDNSAGPRLILVDLPYNLVVQGVNSWVSTLLAQGFTEYWPMDEVAGDYLNAIGSIDLVITLGSSNGIWRQHPGLVVRGPPRSYGASNSGSAANYSQAASGPLATGHLTGTMTVCIRANLDGGSSDPQVPFSFTWSNNSGVFQGFEIFIDGRVNYVLERGGSEFTRARSATGVIERNKPYVLHGVQRADGVGMHIFVNGINVTDDRQIGGTVLGLDAYVDDVFFPVVGEPTQTTVGGVRNGVAAFSGWWSEPAYARNVALSDAQILAAYNASAPLLAASDYHEVVADIILPGGPLDISGDVIDYWATGLHTQSQNNNPPYFSRSSNYLSGNSFDLAGFNISVPTVDFPGSKYPRFKFSWDAVLNANIQNSSGIAISQADTVGSCMIVIEVTEATISQVYYFMGYGSGFGANERNLSLQMVGSALGGNIRFDVKDEVLGNFFQTVHPTNLSIGDIVMVGFVQDGVDGRLYVDGQDVTGGSVVTTGGTFDTTAWIADIPLASPRFVVGGIPGSASVFNPDPNEVHDLFWTPQILTPAHMLAIYNGFQDVF